LGCSQRVSLCDEPTFEGGRTIRILTSPQANTSATRLRAAVLVAVGVLGLSMVVVNAQRGPLAAPTVLEVLIGWSFTASGILIGIHRPANRLGSLMVVVGTVWIVGRSLQLVPHPLTFTAGVWLGDLWSVTFAVFLLAFPTGRLVSATDRAIVWLFVFVTAPLEFLWLLFWAPENGLNPARCRSRRERRARDRSLPALHDRDRSRPPGVCARAPLVPRERSGSVSIAMGSRAGGIVSPNISGGACPGSTGAARPRSQADSWAIG